MPQFQMPIGAGHDAWQSLDSFTQGYIHAAFFTDASTDSECDGAEFDELAPAALASIIAECAAFQSSAAPLLQLAYGADYHGAANWGPYGESQAGNDYWFTRNGHGVGYWDCGLPGTVGDDLSAACRYDSRALYRGDDGMIYHGQG